jgi:hypothetical protein
MFLRPIFGGMTFPYRGFAIAHRHTKVGRTSLDEWSARHRDLYLAIQNNQKRQTSMPLAGFELAIPANERLQTHASRLGHWARSYLHSNINIINNDDLVKSMTTEINFCKAASIIHKLYFLKRLGHNLILLNLSPAVYIPTQKAAIHNTCRIITKFLAER